MPGEILSNGLYFRHCRSLLCTTAEACRCLLLFEGGLHLLTILWNDGLLTLEVLSIEVLTQIGVSEDGVAWIGFVDGLQKQPATDEAIVVRLSGSSRCRCKVLRTVLELDPIY